MTAGAIEEALWSDPADEASWTAFGDELSAQGDDRGELIRVAQLLGRTAPTERPAVASKLDKLAWLHERACETALPAGSSLVQSRYGFPLTVAVEWGDDAVALVERVLRLRFVTGLTVQSQSGTYSSQVEQDDDGVRRIYPSEEGFGALALLNLSRIRELSLAHLGIGPLGAEALAVASRLTLDRTGPATVDLRYAAIGDAGLAALADAPIAGPVRRLHLQADALTAAGMAALARFEHLEEVDLRYNTIGPDGVRALLAAPFIGTLRRLWLNADDVTEAGVGLLAEASELPAALRSYWRGVRASLDS